MPCLVLSQEGTGETLEVKVSLPGSAVFFPLDSHPLGLPLPLTLHSRLCVSSIVSPLRAGYPIIPEGRVPTSPTSATPW